MSLHGFHKVIAPCRRVPPVLHGALCASFPFHQDVLEPQRRWAGCELAAGVRKPSPRALFPLAGPSKHVLPSLQRGLQAIQMPGSERRVADDQECLHVVDGSLGMERKASRQGFVKLGRSSARPAAQEVRFGQSAVTYSIRLDAKVIHEHPPQLVSALPSPQLPGNVNESAEKASVVETPLLPDVLPGPQGQEHVIHTAITLVACKDPGVQRVRQHVGAVAPMLRPGPKILRPLQPTGIIDGRTEGQRTGEPNGVGVGFAPYLPAKLQDLTAAAGNRTEPVAPAALGQRLQIAGLQHHIHRHLRVPLHPPDPQKGAPPPRGPATLHGNRDNAGVRLTVRDHVVEIPQQVPFRLQASYVRALARKPAAPVAALFELGR
mmetsp:Transcript_75694/g.225651  ORF Transcript_75694/g.225651 Transcript_75694/m.225651 type:complete len:377 (+) Transcript_75694:22-1152(+)